MELIIFGDLFAPLIRPFLHEKACGDGIAGSIPAKWVTFHESACKLLVVFNWK